MGKVGDGGRGWVSMVGVGIEGFVGDGVTTCSLYT